MLSCYELFEIRNSIVSEDKLISVDSNEVLELEEKICKSINCYAYVLGIMKTSIFYIPGFTMKRKYDEDSKESFLLSICEDLKNLKIKYRKFGINDKINLKQNEYLIQALFIPNNCDLYFRHTFHFSRMSKNGEWFAKEGRLNQPCFEQVECIYKFDDCEIVEVTSSNCVNKYFRVAYFAIEEKL